MNVRRRSHWSCPIVALLVTLGATAAVPAQVNEGEEYQNLLLTRGTALVTVKYVLKIKMGGVMGGAGDQEMDSEITGVMIDPRGLVLCSNSQLEGLPPILRRMTGLMGGSASSTPTDLKILAGDDQEGLEADLLARDSELDLAWIRIRAPGDRTFAHIDLSEAIAPQIGQRIVMVSRMGKYFDRIPVVNEGRIGGKTTKPRRLYVPAGGISAAGPGAMGLPVYTPGGRIVGITILQSPEADEMGSNPASMFGNLASMQEMLSALILPAEDVAKATRRALESVEAGR